nr:hypothetical protein [Tanacetum cinerariifolium]
MSASTLTSNTGYLSEIEPLTGTNFSTWRDQVKLTLGVMDLDHALRIDPPAALTTESTADQKRVYEQWERSNRMLLMIIKNFISVAIRGVIPDSENVKEYLSSVEEQFKGTSKSPCKKKMTKGNKKGAKRSTRLLELIHTDICGPFPSGIGGHKSFITFIDDYSRYMYLFLINEKSKSLDMFKTFKAEVENQLDHKIKVVRSDRRGEYYGRHTDVGQAPGSFFDFCKDHMIINQYTMPGTPQQNGVAERRNRTLMDMVRSMLANSNLPYFLWTRALKKEGNPTYDICGFEDVQPKLSYTILNHKKLDLKTITLFFIGYPERSKGYRFYCPSHITRIIETRHVKFLENANNSRSGSFRRIELQEARDETPIIHVPIPINAPLDTSNDHLIAQDHPNNVEETESNPEISVEPQETQQPLRKSQRNRQPTKFDDYYTYLNEVDQCVYLKMSKSNFIILVLYVDDILLASNNIDLLHESKRFLSRNFDMKDLGEASYVIGIEIHRDRANGKLGLSQKAYIERVLNRFNMQHCSTTVAPVIKGDVFGSHQCPKTKVEYEEMNQIPNASIVGSLTYAQVCTRPDIAYICGMLGRFQSNPVLLH